MDSGFPPEDEEIYIEIPLSLFGVILDSLNTIMDAMQEIIQDVEDEPGTAVVLQLVKKSPPEQGH